MQKHSERKHAYLSPSGSSRWLNCTPSRKLEEKAEKVAPRKTSVYAEEGTLAHELADLLLNFKFSRIPLKTYRKKLENIRANELYKPEMMGYCNQYVELVLENFNPETDEIDFEVSTDFSKWVKDGSGSVDSRIVSVNEIEGDTLIVDDFKYGKGVIVSAVENSQLMLYALGSFDELEFLYDIKKVQLRIIQPRVNNFSTWELSLEELLQWAEEEVKPKAELAFKGEGEHVTGSWCTFCSGKPICPAFHEQAVEMAKFDFAEPVEIEEGIGLDKVIELYQQSKLFKKWFDSLEHYLFESLKQGIEVPGFKLVLSNTKKRWSNENSVIKVLSELKIDPEEIFNVKLKGIGDISKLVSVDVFEEHIQHLITKPEGKPTIAPISDLRKEYVPKELAAEAFEDEEIEDEF